MEKENYSQIKIGGQARRQRYWPALLSCLSCHPSYYCDAARRPTPRNERPASLVVNAEPTIKCPVPTYSTRVDASVRIGTSAHLYQSRM